MKLRARFIKFIVCLLLIQVSNEANAYFILKGNTNKKGSIFFTENKGQLHDQYGHAMPSVLYILKTPDVNVLFEPTAYHLIYSKIEKEKAIPATMGIDADQQPAKITAYRIDVHFTGANPNTQLSAEDKLDYYEQYYLPGCGPDGISHVRSFGKIIYHDLYPHIDWVVYIPSADEQTGSTGIKYDFVVHPGGDPAQIKMKYEGADVKLDSKGQLLASCALGSFVDHAPIAYIRETGKKVSCSFKLKDNTVSYEAERQDRVTLVIDPSLLWSTYWGGNSWDQLSAVALTNTGGVFMAGQTNSVSGIATVGSYQVTYAGLTDVFLVKIDSNGNPLWSTYYGGDSSDQFSCICSDSIGNVYLGGKTSSYIGIASPGAFQANYAGMNDGFIAAFNSSGIKLWSSYYGGNDVDNVSAIKPDNLGHIYVASGTRSTGLGTPGSYQQFFGGGPGDAFLSKFTDAGSLIWATYFGGSALDGDNGLSLDNLHNIYLVGSTLSTSGIATPGAQQTIYGGGLTGDAYLAKFNPAGVLQWATYYGGPVNENGYSVACYGSSIYISGTTNSTTGIATPSSYQAAYGGDIDIYLVKFNSQGIRQWATYYGGSDEDIAPTLDCDLLGNVLLAGQTRSTNGLVTPGCFQPVMNNVLDAVFAKFNPSGQLQWGSYFGGNSSEGGGKPLSAGLGRFYLTGNTNSTTGIATPGSYMPTPPNIQGCPYLARFYEPDTLPVIMLHNAPTQGCAGDTIIISYLVTGNFDAGNVFSAQISNAAGSFAAPVVIGSTTGVTSGVVYGILPQNILGPYRIRVVSSTPSVISDTMTVTINASVVPSLVLSCTDSSICPGTPVVFTVTPANGGTTPAYQWKKAGVNVGTNSNVYIDSTLTNNIVVYCYMHSSLQCAVPHNVYSNNLVITVYPSPVPVINVNGNVLSTGIYAGYQWYLNNNLISGATNQTISATSATGHYQVEVTDANGCKGKSGNFSLGVNNTTSASGDIYIYPNPSNEMIYINAPIKVNITIQDVTGKVILHKDNPRSIDIGQLAAGLYMVIITDEQNNRIKIEKLVKE